MPPVAQPYGQTQPMDATTSQYATLNQGQTGQQNYGQQQSYQSQFNPGQQMLQGQIPGMFNSLLSGGQVPSHFTAPQQVYDAANSQFSKFVEPGLAMRFGAGSPQIGGQRAYMNQQLAGNLYQQGMGNFMNALNSAGAYATTPMGTTGYQTGQSDQQSTLDGMQSNTTSVAQSLLSYLLGAIMRTI